MPSTVVDAAALALHGQRQAGEHGLPVDEDRAGAALAELAAVLGAGEVEILAEHLEERLVGGGDQVPRLAVDGEGQECLRDASREGLSG